MSSDQNFLPAASSSPLAHMSVKAFASSCVFLTSNPFLRPAPGIIPIPLRVPKATADNRLRRGADALAKTYARNKKLLLLRSITNGLQQTGLLVAYTHRASVHLDPLLSAQRRLGLADDIIKPEAAPTAAMIKNPVT